MNFEFTEEQGMLRDSVARFVQDSYDFDTRRKIAASDTMVMMEEFGKGLVLEPYLATVLLFGGLLQRGGTVEQQAELIPRIIEGGCLGAFAYLERQSRYELADIKTTASARGDSIVLNGEKVVVFNGACADQLIVSARSRGEQSDREGISLFLVPADAAGIERVSYRLMDGQLVANIVFRDVQVPAANLVGELHAGYHLMSEVVNAASIALASEALGIMGQLNAKTLEYTKTRKQFGVAIGSFQALQHRMVDTFMAYEQTKSMLYRAVCELDGGGEDVAACVHALQVMVDRNGKKVFGEAIQLHGGMGITDELDIGHYAKRLMMINTCFGNGDYHQAQFNQLRYSA